MKKFQESYISIEGRRDFPEQAALEEVVAFKTGAMYGPLTDAAMKLHLAGETFNRIYDINCTDERDRDDPHYLVKVEEGYLDWRTEQIKAILKLVDPNQIEGGRAGAIKMLANTSDDELAKLYLDLLTKEADA